MAGLIVTPAEKLLPNLAKLKQTGPGRWVGCCPAHDDNHPSLTIRELDDSTLLVKCWSGCNAAEIVAAAGLQMSDLFPARTTTSFARGERRPFPAADILRAVAFEALVVAQAATAMLAGEPFGQAERERLIVAASRINAALSASGVDHA
jgi:hypothetical protein